ncbi:probable DHA14-like major facilitator; ABC transporter [Rhynchosporium graminicola]|uniref:Probable DHA14-like major facilitator ABC transporter n=1 Tax=Rhynchosporium graminicola TaxID=2792576 RepID=A0A1E1KD70_9HELO|nr:probable DHA14-like major facilitator; ABC transporter [Rhynchosporium commune]
MSHIVNTNEKMVAMDDSPAETLKSDSSVLFDEKGREADGSTMRGSTAHTNEPPSIEHQIRAKEMQAGSDELTRINTSQDGAEYPTGVKLGLISLALCLSVFLIALDNTIIATAIPKITDQFHSLPDVGWYGSAYLLTTASFQLLFGKFYTFFSIKYVYLVAIGIFEVGSLICGVAPNSTALIVGRAVAGLGSAGIFSGALIIVAYSVPLVKRPMYSGFIGAMYGIASVAGPLLGGVFTDKATWRWCFYINLPIGAITMIVILFFFKAPHREAVKSQGWKEDIKAFDIYGTAVFLPAIISLLLALQWGGTKYAWGSWRTILLFVMFGVLVSAFIAIQFWKQETATIPPKIMKQRTMWSACFFSFAMGSFFLLLVYFLPIWFQAVKGASAVQSGIDNLPLVLSLIIVSILSGIGVTLSGYYAPFMVGGTVFGAIGVGLLSTLTPDSSNSMWIGYQCIAGIGIGLGMQQPLIAVQTVLDISLVPIGTSIVIFVQTLGGALFVSIGQNVFSNGLVEGLAKYAPSVDPLSVLRIGATSLQSSPDLNKADLPGVIMAYNDALTKAFLVAAIMAAVTIIGSGAIEWRSVKGKKIDTAMAA